MTAGSAYESSAVRELTYTITNKRQRKEYTAYQEPVLAVYGSLQIKNNSIISLQISTML